MTAEELAKRIDELRYQLEDVDSLMRGMSKEQYEKGGRISALRLHTVRISIFALMEALDNLSVVEKRILGG